MGDKEKILVIDDEQGILDMIKYEFESQGYGIITALSGEEGVKMAGREKPDICISDIKLPGMSGTETLKRLKEMDQDMEVIMATGYGTVENAVQSLRYGAFDYLTKPFDISYMEATIQRALERRRLKETLALYKLSKIIFSTLDMDSLLENIMKSVMEVARADDASIMLTDEEGKLYIAASKTLNKKLKDETRISIGERISGKAAQSGEGFILVNGLSNDRRFKDIEGRGEIKSAVVVPLKNERGLIGVLNVNRLKEEAVFRESDLKKITIFASLATLAISNASLHGEIKKIQDELIQSEKMAAVGRLAGGVAHEINNPLGGILGTVQLLMEETDKESDIYGELEIIEKLSKRCGDIVGRLLEFSRKDSGQLEKVDINRVIEETVTMVSRQSGFKNINIKFHPDNSLPEIMGSKQKIGQIFLNFILNAKDALPEGGEITIFTKSRLKDGERYLLAGIKDNGEGIKPEIIKNIFDPFFTTKKRGSGTGLGLSIVKSIAERLGASVNVESRPGCGSEFRILFPLQKDERP